jgi:hypothetical protein
MPFEHRVTDGSLPASLEREELVGLEFAYTSITEEGTELSFPRQFIAKWLVLIRPPT